MLDVIENVKKCHFIQYKEKKKKKNMLLSLNDAYVSLSKEFFFPFLLFLPVSQNRFSTFKIFQLHFRINTVQKRAKYVQGCLNEITTPFCYIC